ncbi:MAG: hypothetical protein M3P44_10820, partial [Actinomycetota bacterium]|nr:hypothetical protein [Actinomycetota bacterium]
MQHLAGVRARGEDRVITALAGVAKRCALLFAAVNLADERVDVDDQPAGRRSGARLPRARERVGQDAVELADMPKRERAQKRAQRRRRRDPVTEDLAGSPGAQDVAVVNAVRAERHRRDERHDLRTRVRRARPVAEADGPLDER